MVVTRSELELYLDALASTCDPIAGVFGPDSQMWRVARESIVFLGGGRAALLQLAHPWVATAVSHHSNAEHDLAGRFLRTFRSVFSMTFGDLPSALETARRVHALHDTIRGHLDEPLGPWPAQSPYAANEEHALLWVQATLVDTSVSIFEQFIAPLTDDERESLWQDHRRSARLFGISDRILPPTWPDFRRYFDAMISGPELHIGTASKDLSRFLLTPPNPRVRPLWAWYAAVTAGLMPPHLRAPLGLRYGPLERTVHDLTVAALRPWRHLPSRLRHLPAYREATRRLAGDRRPERIIPYIEGLLTRILAQR